MGINYSEVLKECRKLSKEQGLEFRRSKTVGTINGFACYEIESGIVEYVLHQGSLVNVWEHLLSGYFKGK